MACVRANCYRLIRQRSSADPQCPVYVHTTRDGLCSAVVLTHIPVYVNTAKGGLGSAVVLTN